MHLTVVVTLFVSLCYSSPFDFESYNIQWEVPLPVGSFLDFSLPEESNLSDLTTVLPVVTLADVDMTSVIPNVVNISDYSVTTIVLPVVTSADLDLVSVTENVADIQTDSDINVTELTTELSANFLEKDISHVTNPPDADIEPKVTSDSAEPNDLLPAQMTFISKLTFVNNTLDDLVDEATDLADQAANASSNADPDNGPHPSDLSAWEMLFNFMDTQGGLAVLFTVITIGQLPTCLPLHFEYCPLYRISIFTF